MARMFAAFTIILALAIPRLDAQQPSPGGARVPSIEERTNGMQKLEGYFPLYWEERAGIIWLEIPKLDVEFLYATGLAAGLGSNDIGLDRGQQGGGRIVVFQRVGPKILLVQPNYAFRSSSTNPLERRSVEDSFARSVLWGFTVAAETGDRVLVDASDFLLRDVTNSASSLRPGNYRVDRSRSAFYMPRTKAFPKNTEIETTLTFVTEPTGGRGGGGGPAQGPTPIGVGGGRPGGFGGGLFSGTVGSVTPTPDTVTLREHVSLVELPDGRYQPRREDPRAGYGAPNYVDFSVPVGDSIVRRAIRRHRLEKKDPNLPMSEPIRPITYYVDSGAPEDVRNALVEGASWWSQAFEAAGFRNAFKVEILPDGADPMDIRYNMINWVHRSTRGWSSGATISDPRTGEIIKATVTLGSLRDRQDYLIFEGLLSPYANGDERPAILYETAMKRIRQLAAHEVGHTLGLGHNYYNSSRGWISVMDYPHPQEILASDGTIDLSQAYASSIGEWDKVAIDYGYRELAAGTSEAAALTPILDKAWDADLRYLTNQDIDAHPRADQWTSGADAADELNRLMKVRRGALGRMGERTIRNDAPMATIEEPLVPIFMYHRYAVESSASMIAGLDYTYGMRGDGRAPVGWVAARDQSRALEALAATLRPAELVVPKPILDKIPPRPPGFGLHRELFPRTTGEGFDPLSPAMVAADVTIGFVLELERAARMVAQQAVDPALPGLEDVIDRLIRATFDARTASAYEAEVRRVEERVLVDRVMWLATASPNTQVRAIAALKLSRLASRLGATTAKSDGEVAHSTLLAADIKRFLERPAEVFRLIPAPDAPPGAPIGDPGRDWLARAPWCTWTEDDDQQL